MLRFVSDVFASTIMRFAARITTGVKPKFDGPQRIARAVWPTGTRTATQRARQTAD